MTRESTYLLHLLQKLFCHQTQPPVYHQHSEEPSFERRPVQLLAHVPAPVAVLIPAPHMVEVHPLAPVPVQHTAQAPAQLIKAFGNFSIESSG